ncbi:glycosyltransferase family 2 protein [Ruminobacter sp.]|uniref:glycosyltransferase family 2 protein n=1 Tax=Ruminobacter sp. TaxID=2774296 RepID=UPI0038648BAB
MMYNYRRPPEQAPIRGDGEEAGEFRPCIVVPCYRHVEPLMRLLPELLRFGLKIIVVDDGNREPKASKLREQVNLMNQVIVRHEVNMGKGAAVHSGFKKAAELGFTHVLQIDADGQHDLRDITAFINLGRQNTDKIINGTPVYDSSVPLCRKLGRYMTHFWVGVELGTGRVVDTMCGMRLYPLEQALKVMNSGKVGRRMDFDTGIFVRMYWSGVDFLEVPVNVKYLPGNYSNFKGFSDNVRISLMHTRLCTEKVVHYRTIRKREYL